MLEATKHTCDEYRRMVALGGDPGEIVTGLASTYSVNRPAIWKRLRTGVYCHRSAQARA
jgi:hypothetical protein